MDITNYILRCTSDGKSVVDFLVDTMDGRTPDASPDHRFKSAIWLATYGGIFPNKPIPVPPSAPSGNTDKDTPDKKPPVTEKQILNYDIARLIKQDTNDCKDLIDFLVRVVTKQEKFIPPEYFNPAARMRAAKELLTRGFGSMTRRRIPSGKHENLNSTVAKITRQLSNDGMDAVNILIRAVENEDPDKTCSDAHGDTREKPIGFTASQRVEAACELLHRALDIRTDHITPEDIQAYWTSQTPIDARARETYANAGRPDINRTGIDKATALAAMAAKPAETQAVADKPALAAIAAIAPPANANSVKRETPEDPFPPKGKARMGTSPIANTNETQTNAKPAANNERETAPANSAEKIAAAVSKHANHADSASNPKTPSRPSDFALKSPQNNPNNAAGDERENDPEKTPHPVEDDYLYLCKFHPLTREQSTQLSKRYDYANLPPGHYELKYGEPRHPSNLPPFPQCEQCRSP